MTNPGSVNHVSHDLYYSKGQGGAAMFATVQSEKAMPAACNANGEFWRSTTPQGARDWIQPTSLRRRDGKISTNLVYRENTPPQRTNFKTACGCEACHCPPRHFNKLRTRTP